MAQVVDVTGELLKSVSRSFYLTIRFLPRQMRPAVALGYMLARATDSVADAFDTPQEVKLRALQAMRCAIDADEENEDLQALHELLTQQVAPTIPCEAERVLLGEFCTCLSALRVFPEQQRMLVRKVLGTIIEGQVWDLTAFDACDTVQTDDDTRRYTYMVAGCVGAFWTELGYATMGEAFCPASRKDLMLQAGVRYGQGLQLINILRDREEDARRGRHYLCSDATKWLRRAESYMNDGVDYSRRLGTFRLRFASVLPALIGKRTLRLLADTPLGQGKVKIRRRAVYGALLQAVGLCLWRKRRVLAYSEQKSQK